MDRLTYFDNPETLAKYTNSFRDEDFEEYRNEDAPEVDINDNSQRIEEE